MPLRQDSHPTPQESVAQLKRMLSAGRFKAATVQSKLLRFVVMQTLQRKETNETIVGLGVFNNYDPTSHKVRQNISFLRARIESYYADEGNADLVTITIPPGAYVAAFGYNFQSGALRKYLQSFRYRKDIASRDAWSKAQRLLVQATELAKDTYAPALAAYAENNLLRIVFDEILGVREETIELAKLALAVSSLAAKTDPNLGLAHTVVGSSYLFRFQKQLAKASFEKALKLAPTSTKASLWYAVYLVCEGNLEDGIQIAQSQVNEHPESLAVGFVHAFLLYLRRDFTAAHERLNELSPDRATEKIHRCLLELIFLATGDSRNVAVNYVAHCPISEEELKRTGPPKAIDFSEMKPLLGLYALSLAGVGRLDGAERITSIIRFQHPVKRLQLAIAYMAIGEKGRAVAALHLAVWKDRNPFMNVAHLLPLFDPLRDHPSFHRIASTIARFK